MSVSLTVFKSLFFKISQRQPFVKPPPGSPKSLLKHPPLWLCRNRFIQKRKDWDLLLQTSPPSYLSVCLISVLWSEIIALIFNSNQECTFLAQNAIFTMPVQKLLGQHTTAQDRPTLQCVSDLPLISRVYRGIGFSRVKRVSARPWASLRSTTLMRF